MTVNTVRSLLENAALTAPDKSALVMERERYSYRELLNRVNQVANYLKTQGFAKGSRIGIYSNKSCDQVIAILAILSTEYMFVPITRLLKPEQVRHIIDDCNISCIITDSKKIKNIQAVNYSGKIISYESTDQSDVSFEEIFK